MCGGGGPCAKDWGYMGGPGKVVYGRGGGAMAIPGIGGIGAAMGG